MKKLFAAATAFVTLCAADAPPASPVTDLAAAFGARASLQHLSLSPDGKTMAFAAPAHGEGFVVYTLSTAPGSVQKQVLYLDGNPNRLAGCHWVSNNRLVCVLYAVFKGPLTINSAAKLVALDADGSNLKYLPVGEVLDWLPDQDGMILIHTRDGLMRVNTRTQVQTLQETDPSTAFDYLTDGHGTVRVIGLARHTVGVENPIAAYFYRPVGSRAMKPIGDYNYVTETGFLPEAVDYERNAVYGIRKLDGRKAVYRFALDGSGKEELVFARPDVDVDALITMGRRKRVVGATYISDVRHTVYFDPALEKLAAALGKALPGKPVVRIAESDLDEQRLLIWAGSDTDPGQYYLLDRATHALLPFNKIRPQLDHMALATVRFITYPAADGTMIPAHLTLPVGSTGKGLPVIVLPHGGPSARDEGEFDWLAQYYVARGFAVLQPEFRGSVGYGDAWFKNNGFKSWRIAIGDVCDAGRWAIAQGIADPSKLAIVGWSYGGYAALQSAVLDPSLFKAVVAIAPVTDLVSVRLERTYLADRAFVADFIGDGPHLREGSPAQNAKTIKAPVLLFHGELDSNVRIFESELMAEKLKAAGVPHQLVSFPQLGHSLDDSDARATMLRKSDAFLRASMGM